MRAALAVGQGKHEFMSVSVSNAAGQWIAGGLFRCLGKRAEFLGASWGDYLDVVVDRSIGAAEAAELKMKILTSVLSASNGPTEVLLRNVPTENATASAWERCSAPLYALDVRSGPAPTLEMTNAEQVLNSKNIRRCENRVRRHGDVTCLTYRTAEEILPRLEPFFEQHVRRWQGSGTPSLFEKDCHREFYERLTIELSCTGTLRFTEIRFGDRLAAAHYGFMDAGRFIWYKPTYEPALSELSPGVVLLARLVRQALEENARELDFTIGNEAFKDRYATRKREVVDYLVTNSLLCHAQRKMTLSARRAGVGALKRLGLFERAKSVLRDR
jgi:CelD/BcsL family acetyltransferase involved in cellulose biosynthesis